MPMLQIQKSYKKKINKLILFYKQEINVRFDHKTRTTTHCKKLKKYNNYNMHYT